MPPIGATITGQPSSANIKLDYCRLAEFFVSEGDLLAFLKAHPPRRFSSHHVRVINRSWAPILEHLYSPHTSIESYHLDDIVEGSSILMFQVHAENAASIA
ncbi:hypothetical protein PWT90_03282 [Aphanocladium album]|nr:hypothetical protein PWT90_03282 [Aphanocladium album]